MRQIYITHPSCRNNPDNGLSDAEEAKKIAVTKIELAQINARDRIICNNVIQHNFFLSFPDRRFSVAFIKAFLFLAVRIQNGLIANGSASCQLVRGRSTGLLKFLITAPTLFVNMLSCSRAACPANETCSKTRLPVSIIHYTQ